MSSLQGASELMENYRQRMSQKHVCFVYVYGAANTEMTTTLINFGYSTWPDYHKSKTKLGRAFLQGPNTKNVLCCYSYWLRRQSLNIHQAIKDWNLAVSLYNGDDLHFFAFFPLQCLVDFKLLSKTVAKICAILKALTFGPSRQHVW